MKFHPIRLGSESNDFHEFEAIENQFQQNEILIFTKTMTWQFVEPLRLDLCTFPTS